MVTRVRLALHEFVEPAFVNAFTYTFRAAVQARCMVPWAAVELILLRVECALCVICECVRLLCSDTSVLAFGLLLFARTQPTESATPAPP